MPSPFNEETVEKLAVQWLGELGYGYADGAALDESGQRASVREVVLESRLREAVDRLNPTLPPAIRDRKSVV